MSALFELVDFRVRIGTRQGPALIVNGVDWGVEKGETLAIVGESGSGKSMSVLSATGLVPSPPALFEGQALFDGQDLLALSDKEQREIRGRHVGFVFQEPMTSLNPLLTIGRQMAEAPQQHLGMSKGEARDKAAELLSLVGIPEARRRLDAYPHQLSGGMRQRVMIAMALMCDPELLIADEPTTALDVTTQAQILDLVTRLQQQFGMAVVWITHDLGVVADFADQVAVMYAGRIVEQAPTSRLYRSPAHPYTHGLLAARPRLGEPELELATIPGVPPDPKRLPRGCSFYPRCPYRQDPRCEMEVPPLVEIDSGHFVRSFYSLAEEPVGSAP
ncbi:MAG: ABC transporter ATP-binding protein [Chloroflexota bacterium]